jgi:hypothetical protein
VRREPRRTFINVAGLWGSSALVFSLFVCPRVLDQVIPPRKIDGQNSSTIDQDERRSVVICSWALLVKSPPATRRGQHKTSSDRADPGKECSRDWESTQWISTP